MRHTGVELTRHVSERLWTNFVLQLRMKFSSPMVMKYLYDLQNGHRRHLLKRLSRPLVLRANTIFFATPSWTPCALISISKSFNRNPGRFFAVTEMTEMALMLAFTLLQYDIEKAVNVRKRSSLLRHKLCLRMLEESILRRYHISGFINHSVCSCNGDVQSPQLSGSIVLRSCR